MSGIKDLLGDTPYPASPGYKEPTTSQAAAKAVRGRAMTLRIRALKAIRDAGGAGLTADEVAEKLGESVLAIRPRITELTLEQSIRDSGLRRANASGVKAKVWWAS